MPCNRLTVCLAGRDSVIDYILHRQNILYHLSVKVYNANNNFRSVNFCIALLQLLMLILWLFLMAQFC